MATWTLKNGSTTQSLADWGIQDFELSRPSFGLEVVTPLANGRAIDAALLWPANSAVTIYKDGVPYFQGTVRRVRFSGSNSGESHQYQIAGPWWYLEELTFKQDYLITVGLKNPSDPSQGFNTETRYLCGLFLCQYLDPFGSVLGFLNTGQQIAKILQWAIKPFTDAAAPAPFQFGAVSPITGVDGFSMAVGGTTPNVPLAVNAPLDQVKNITCAEAIRKMFRWSPDCVAWFDHSTTPPTFYCKPRAALAAFNLDLGMQRPTSINLTPQYERQRSFVKLEFDVVSYINGSPFLNQVFDTYPNPLPTEPDAQYRGLEQVIDLRGPSSNSQNSTVETKDLATGDINWWLGTQPADAKAKQAGEIKTYTLVPGSVVVENREGGALLSLPRQLVSGQILPWMNVNAQRQRATCEVDITYSDNTNFKKRLSYDFTATNAVSANYSTVTSSDSGDLLPIGLAQSLYEALSVLPYSGTIEFERDEVGDVGGLGNKYNIIGAANGDWATMNALVQQVTERPVSGYTRLELGWPEHLMAGDYVDLLRVARSRFMYSSPGQRLGNGTSGGAVTTGGRTAEANSTQSAKGGTGGQGNMVWRGTWTNAPTSPYLIGHMAVLGPGVSAGSYVCVLDNNSNSPDSGNGWVQTGSLTGNNFL